MISRFNIIEAPLSNLRIIQRNFVVDHRGYLERVFCESDLQNLLAQKHIVQINHSLTARKGTVRGMHFQNTPFAEIKFISCLKGEVFDVAVDLRKDSPTFLQWHAEILSENNHRTYVIPEGFAHGFQALSDNCELLYLHTAPYMKSSEGALNVLDPRIGIQWALPVVELSARDQSHPFLDNNFSGINI